MRVLWRYTQWRNVVTPSTWTWLTWTALVSFALNVFWIVFSIVNRPQLTVFDRYTKLHSIPLVDEHALSDPHPVDGHGNVIATSFFTDEFATAIATLGHSLNRVNTTARRLALYIPEQVSPRALCIASATGFEPHPVQRIEPPNNGEGIFPHFVDQFTKLRIWELGATAGARGVVYLDADTLALRNFDELFALPFALAAAPDVYTNKPWGVSFNAGVLFLRPSARVFRALVAAIDTAPYWRHEAEQALLNAFFAADVAKLPYAYNANLAIKAYSRAVWAGIAREIRVVHYTMVKPFTRDNKDYALVPMDELAANARRRSAEEGGVFVEEMELWAQTWQELYETYGHELRRCMTLSDKPGAHEMS